MNPFTIVSTLIFLGLSASACGASNDALRARAAFDLNCSEDKLAIVELSTMTHGVTGCGRRAAYVQRCGGGVCTWMQDGARTGRAP
jgi:hypothetical protein